MTSNDNGRHHHDGHGHDHDADHAPIQSDEPTDRFEYVLESAIRELLIEKGVLTAADIHRQIDLQDSRTPALGSKVVARAWVDPEFKRELLADAIPAINRHFDADIRSPFELKVLEDTAVVHNMIVCTLCSCYPRMLLGFPPDWYKSIDYRSRAVREPRKVLEEFGVILGGDIEVRVADSTADLRYLVLPLRPAGTENLSEQALADLVTRDCMVGTAIPVYDSREASHG